jgi:hypothetical protein
LNDADVIFEWTVHPIADFPKRRIVFLIAVSLTVWVIWISYHEIFWAAFALIFLLSALNSFILPTRYRLSKDELEIFRIFAIKQRKLTDVRRVDLAPNGFFLSPLRIPARLEHYRGVFLPYPPNKDEVHSFLLEHIRQPQHTGGTTQEPRT